METTIKRFAQGFIGYRFHIEVIKGNVQENGNCY